MIKPILELFIIEFVKLETLFETNNQCSNASDIMHFIVKFERKFK